MSRNKRNAKRASRARWWKATGITDKPSRIDLILRDAHTKSHPWCTRTEPHFVPPSFNEPGFYLCESERPDE
jgi:hypothetical protein